MGKGIVQVKHMISNVDHILETLNDKRKTSRCGFEAYNIKTVGGAILFDIEIVPLKDFELSWFGLYLLITHDESDISKWHQYIIDVDQKVDSNVLTTVATAKADENFIKYLDENDNQFNDGKPIFDRIVENGKVKAKTAIHLNSEFYNVFNYFIETYLEDDMSDIIATNFEF